MSVKICFTVFFMVVYCWANEDLLRDVRAGNIQLHELHKRSVLNVNSNNGNSNGRGNTADGIRYAAQQFANYNGNSNRNVGSVIGNGPNGNQIINSCLNSNNWNGNYGNRYNNGNQYGNGNHYNNGNQYGNGNQYNNGNGNQYSNGNGNQHGNGNGQNVNGNNGPNGNNHNGNVQTILSGNVIGNGQIQTSKRVKRAAPTTADILLGGPLVTRTTTAAPPEQLNNRDLVFVLDTSGSIPSDQFEIAKTAISLLVEYLCPSEFDFEVTKEGTKQISVVLFGRTQTTEISFEQSHKGLGYLKDAILSMVHRSEGATATSDALKYVREVVMVQPYSRLQNKQVATDIIVITDGQCNVNCQTLGTEADKLRVLGNGVNVFALGVANARACELEIISGEGTNLSYGLSDFNNLEQFAEAIKSLGQESDKKCA